MPVSFRRLRIAGFKSFAEPTSVEIMPGLTGVVGPNGCGKSNVVEALRWAMGESNARNLRGGEMEDVIFAGTAGRASRNIAEVSLYLDEAHGRAPPPFHEQDELEIVRRIERGSGSAYRINGKDVRARDVQTLFADLASGSRASAMVSQGRVGTLVNARPEDRRSVLEEAANITGLHARRHEAELKLRAAEANLARAEDLRGQLESQLGSLKRQARQASRYRNISGTIRAAEAELLAVQKARVEQDRARAATALQAAEQAVAVAAEAVKATATQATEAAAAVLPLREREADARTVLERHRVAQEQIAGEEQRARTALAEAQRRIGQIRQDLAHAQQLQADAAAADERLAAEEATLVEAETGHDARTETATASAAEAADAVREAEAAANRATEAAAEANARAQAAAQLTAQAEQRATRLNGQFQAATQERERVAAQQVDPALIARATGEAAEAEAAATAARAAVEQAEQARATAATALVAARDAQSTADSARAKLAAECQALAEVLAVKDGERWPPMVDSLTVADGLEAALGAVLGEELTSALNPAAPRHWRELPAFDPVPALPACATPLAAHVQGPAVLARALSQIGLVESDQDGFDYQSALLPGQSLVARSGAIWRWDGYTIRAGTPTAAAVRLQQRNRLATLRKRLEAAEQTAAAARTERAAAETAAQASVQAEQQARTTRREWEQKLERARAGLTSLRNQAATATARLTATDEQLARVTAERDEAVAALAQVREANTALPDVAALRAAVDLARAALSEARARETAARTERDSLSREHAARVNRRRVIIAERAGWAERAKDAGDRVVDLTARQAEAEDALRTLEANPAQIAARRAEALDELQGAETTHRRAAKALAAAVNAATEADKAARAAEQALASRREDAVRAEGVAQQADHAWGTVAERILERLGANPTLPDPPPEPTQEVEDKARRKLERLVKEREEMGPVNLRAEQEAEDVEKRIATIETDRSEMTTAIAKLRGSIGHLNREGRERLTAVFQEVDKNFQQLFTHMFGGGRAQLALVGSDDPLEAGLEIYAQPPGKKLAALSLLSGGEQALTALSLIFAVFRCNPAPVCVLDEVDAPLDDANVDRFCTLLEDMVRDTGTRFMVVTHHPLTMARMDRLYGVTMQERGVSRLLSVDLAAATEMVDPPRLAAE
ncbi:chromosome segregation SMC family protein [Rhodopila globiformis]|uniref:Chromosome partition protein Smc n=1 Tax=Rhodopila globiformis TaxID=1071 RepID=A0A2S6NIA4_RHOGL|nr:AAA family ATPase [Rhodopila globiformis]PPQ34280.1 chromosome segregation protein SMC [Rhodopila globiformis]